MMLINGVICLVAAVVLLVQIKKSQDLPINVYLLKACWLQFALLMILAIHRIFNGMMEPWLDSAIQLLDPIADIANASLGFLIAFYLVRKRVPVKNEHND